MNRRRIWGALLVLIVTVATVSAEAPWVNNLSNAERSRTNPYGNKPDAIAAGGRLFAEHCAKCHGADALGNRKHPSLRTTEVQQAADSEIFWLLKNGALRHGMPSWSSLPEPMRWQIVAYIKSLGQYSASR